MYMVPGERASNVRLHIWRSGEQGVTRLVLLYLLADMASYSGEFEFWDVMGRRKRS